MGVMASVPREETGGGTFGQFESPPVTQKQQGPCTGTETPRPRTPMIPGLRNRVEAKNVFREQLLLRGSWYRFVV